MRATRGRVSGWRARAEPIAIPNLASTADDQSHKLVVGKSRFLRFGLGRIQNRAGPRATCPRATSSGAGLGLDLQLTLNQ